MVNRPMVNRPMVNRPMVNRPMVNRPMANQWRERYAPRVVTLLPPSLPANGEDRFTGIGCPDCSGVLTLRTHGTLVTFACRIGHMYSCAQLLATKEDILERELWTAFSSLEELAILLEDFRRHGLEATDPENQRRRGAMAREQAARLWSVIEADRPLPPRAAEAFGDVP
jgi:hypothetical protein